MSRQAFLDRLRLGLAGLPAATIAEIVADHEAHFAEGEAAGRSEAEVAQALGDPGRLARELRAEAGLKRWEAERNPSAAAAAVFAVLGLGAIDLLILLPIVLSIAGTLLGLFVAVIALFGAGGLVFTVGPFMDPPGGVATALLAGIGLMAGSVSLGAIVSLVTVGFVNLLVWYGRLHYRLLKPAIEPQA